MVACSSIAILIIIVADRCCCRWVVVVVVGSDDDAETLERCQFGRILLTQLLHRRATTGDDLASCSEVAIDVGQHSNGPEAAVEAFVLECLQLLAVLLLQLLAAALAECTMTLPRACKPAAWCDMRRWSIGSSSGSSSGGSGGGCEGAATAAAVVVVVAASGIDEMGTARCNTLMRRIDEVAVEMAATSSS